MKMTAVSSASSSRTPPSSTSTARNNNNNNNNNNQCYDRSIGGGGGGGFGGGDSSSCYYPGCRKDANCHCDICLHSFNSTRDLILNQSSSLLTKRKIVYPKNKKISSSSPSSSPYTPQSTPDSSLSFRSSPSPPPPQIAKPNKPGAVIKKREEEKGSSWGLILCKVVFVLAALIFLWAMDSGFLMLVSKNDVTKLTPDAVRGFVEEGRAMQGDFKVKLGILQRKVEGVVGVGEVSNCSSKDSLWKLNQEGHHFFFQWRCVIYQSMTEELSVWGSPLQTSGLLIAGISSRSITLFSGSITEWSDGRLVPTLRTGNSSSWTLGKWSSAAVQLERETWLLEYQRSALFEGPGLIQTTRDILMLKLQKIVRKLKLRLLIRRTIAGSYYSSSKDKNHFKNPT